MWFSHFLESSLDFQSFLMHFMLVINFQKSKTIFKSSLKSHVYWDTLYDIFKRGGKANNK